MIRIDTGVRYVIVNKETEALDWDDQMYDSADDCIASLCGPYQEFVRTKAEADAAHALWSDVYEIRRVLPVKAKRS